MKGIKVKANSPVKLALAAIAAVCSLYLVAHQYGRYEMDLVNSRLAKSEKFAEQRRRAAILETDDGRQLLWARGPRDVQVGEWFDVTGAPLDPQGYQYGIGKDTIPAIDEPEFVSIQAQKKLRECGIDHDTRIIGYVHGGEAKAYPIEIMNRHELVNDVVGGKPVTVGW